MSNRTPANPPPRDCNSHHHVHHQVIIGSPFNRLNTSHFILPVRQILISIHRIHVRQLERLVVAVVLGRFICRSISSALSFGRRGFVYIDGVIVLGHSSAFSRGCGCSWLHSGGLGLSTAIAGFHRLAALCLPVFIDEFMGAAVQEGGSQRRWGKVKFWVDEGYGQSLCQFPNMTLVKLTNRSQPPMSYALVHNQPKIQDLQGGRLYQLL